LGSRHKRGKSVASMCSRCVALRQPQPIFLAFSLILLLSFLKSAELPVPIRFQRIRHQRWSGAHASSDGGPVRLIASAFTCCFRSRSVSSRRPAILADRQRNLYGHRVMISRSRSPTAWSTGMPEPIGRRAADSPCCVLGKIMRYERPDGKRGRDRRRSCARADATNGQA